MLPCTARVKGSITSFADPSKPIRYVASLAVVDAIARADICYCAHDNGLLRFCGGVQPTLHSPTEQNHKTTMQRIARHLIGAAGRHAVHDVSCSRPLSTSSATPAHLDHQASTSSSTGYLLAIPAIIATGLGYWQVERRAWKQDVLQRRSASINVRTHQSVNTIPHHTADNRLNRSTYLTIPARHQSTSASPLLGSTTPPTHSTSAHVRVPSWAVHK